VLWAYTYGYNFGNTKVSDTRMWEVMKNWPAGYQLLPDYPSIQDDATGKFWTMDQLLAGQFYSEQEYQHTTGWRDGRVATYSPEPGLRMQRSQKMHLRFTKVFWGFGEEVSVGQILYGRRYRTAHGPVFHCEVGQSSGFNLPYLNSQSKKYER